MNSEQNLNRRKFIQQTVICVSAAAVVPGILTSCSGASGKLPMGASLFGYRDLLIEDFPGTLKKVYDAGYRVVEYYSAKGAPEKMGMVPLAKIPAKEVRKMIDDAGLKMVSCHYYPFGNFLSNLDERIDYASELGLEHMVIAANGRFSLDGWLKRCDEMNEIGAKVKKAGMKLGFHNHSNEFDTVDGVLIYDEMMRRLDPELVGGQIHLREPASVVRNYPNRILSLHLPTDYSASGESGVPIGQGIIDWQDILTAAKENGVEYYFVEMGMDAVMQSAPYLKNLKY